MLLSVLVAAALSVAPVHQYVLKHPKHEHCRAHYVRQRKIIKHRVHGRTIKTKETVCVYVKPQTKAPEPAPVAPKPTPSPTPTPTPQPEGKVEVKEEHPAKTPEPPNLKAIIKSGFVQGGVKNPLNVTYTVKAEADEGTTPLASLPKGTITVYSDSKGVCLLSVGGATNEGTCEVQYEHYGSHELAAVYESEGRASSPAKTVEMIEPYPITIEEHWGEEPEPVTHVKRIHENEYEITVRANFHGAKELTIVTFPGEHECLAHVFGEEAVCEDINTEPNPPGSVALHYPGGQSEVSHEAFNGGEREVTRTWPADIWEESVGIEA